jgi:CRP-like cAMP-binding protein
MNLFDYFNLFHPISGNDYEQLTNELKPKSFKKDEIIVAPGQIAKRLFFVKSGIQMSYFETDKRIHVIAFTYFPNLCTIPESFSFQTPSKYFLISLTDSEMDFISFDALQKLLDQNRRIERLFRRMTEAVLAGVINRHIELHSLSIRDRYKAFCQRSPHLLHLIPHKYIASYLSIDPTNFSKLFNKVKF